jgi:hypothetical protein
MTLRRLLLAFVASVVLLTAAGVAYYFSKSTALESWIGSQLLTFTGTYINPDLHFKKLTYVRPSTVLLEDMSLTSPDPAQPGTEVTILAVKKARIELAEVPRPGQPLKFSQVILESPEVRAIAPGSGAGGFVGFTQFLKSAQPAAPQNAPAGPPGPPQPVMKLSDLLLIHHVELNNALIRYDRRIAGLQPMQLDAINLHLDFVPANPSAPGAPAGLYTIKTSINRPPVFQLDIDGTLDIDTLTAKLRQLTLALDLQEKNAHFLPPEIQQVLNSFEISGQFQLTCSGTLPFASPADADLHSAVTLHAAHTAFGKYRLAVDSFDADLDVSRRATVIRKADARLLGGTIHLAGEIPNDRDLPAQLQLALNNIRIEQTLRTLDPRELPPYAGSLDADIHFTGPPTRWATQAGGGGHASLRQGRIGDLPLLGKIIVAVNSLLAKTLGQNSRQLADSAEARFVFAGDRVRLEMLEARSSALALRATGTIGFNGALDLRLNAGPLEKLQNSMGILGDIWGAASDALVSYRVTGNVAAPQVRLQVGNRR